MSPYIEVWIPIVPKGKQRHRIANGRAYTPQQTRRFEASIRKAVAASYDGDPVTCGVRIIVDAFFARPKKPHRGHLCNRSDGPHPLSMGGSCYPDSSNVLKAAEDAMNGVAYVDDAQAADVQCRRWWVARGDEPGMHIRVWVIS